VKVRKAVQIEYVWAYRALAVEGRAGQLFWRWMEGLKGEEVAQAVRQRQEEGIEGMVWDGARGHQASGVQQVGVILIQQPLYSSEWNPAGRVLEEIRRRVEGGCIWTWGRRNGLSKRSWKTWPPTLSR
jgi:hypothetical protein